MIQNIPPNLLQAAAKIYVTCADLASKRGKVSSWARPKTGFNGDRMWHHDLTLIFIGK